METEYPQIIGLETIYQSDLILANPIPDCFCFSSCSSLGNHTFGDRMLWNYICGAAFRAAATSMPLLFPKEVGLKLILQDERIVYFPIWKISRENFNRLVMIWERILFHFKRQHVYNINQNTLNCARMLVDEVKVFSGAATTGDCFLDKKLREFMAKPDQITQYQCLANSKFE